MLSANKKCLLIILIDNFTYPYYILDYNISQQIFYTAGPHTLAMQLDEVSIEESIGTMKNKTNTIYLYTYDIK